MGRGREEVLYTKEGVRLPEGELSLVHLSTLDEGYTPFVLEALGLSLPEGVLGEALARRLPVVPGKPVLRQGQRYVAFPEGLGGRLFLWKAPSAQMVELRASALPALVRTKGRFFQQVPRGPLVGLVLGGRERELKRLRGLGNLLLAGYLRAAAWGRRFPGSSRTARRVWAREEGVHAGGKLFPYPLPPFPSPGEPLSAMRSYWSQRLLEWRAGDWRSLAPEPLPSPEGSVAYTPLWAALL